MQTLVDTIFPHFEQEDAKNEIAFYKQHNIPLKQLVVSDTTSTTTKEEEIESEVEGEGEDKLSFDPNQPHKRIRKRGPKTLPDMSIRLVPDERESVPIDQQMPRLKKSLITTSPKLKILHLKKYLQRKMEYSKAGFEIEILCKEMHLGSELSLEFIRLTRWVDEAHDMVLKYRWIRCC